MKSNINIKWDNAAIRRVKEQAKAEGAADVRRRLQDFRCETHGQRATFKKHRDRWAIEGCCEQFVQHVTRSLRV